MVRTHRLVVAISSRALFDLDESHQIYESQGIEAYCDYQIQHEDEPLQPGLAFPLVKKLLGINLKLEGRAEIEVVLLSRNSADTGLRVFNSIDHHGLKVTRAAFTGGEKTHKYAQALGAHLFLSANADDVRKALDSGIAAATILSGMVAPDLENTAGKLRIAFDGDAVIFSGESERIYQEQGLKAFEENEIKAAKEPMRAGPFRQFLSVLHEIQNIFPADQSPIRTALVTARAAPTHERVIRTLRVWGVRIDEALFLGGHEKSQFLKAFQADIFFDDQAGHCEKASQHVPTGHVPQDTAMTD